MDNNAPLFIKINELIKTNKRITVALDGNCAAGKTTIAAKLKSMYNCNVFAMDDFFLRSSQRSPKRLCEIGGNIDYERFAKEVLFPIQTGAPFAYKPYNCQTQAFDKPVNVVPTLLNIIEGTYSLHPYFGKYYDLAIFLSVDANEQRRRLLARNEKLYDRFINDWIPKENNYFETFNITEKCDLIF